MTMRAPAALALLVGLAGCATVDHAVDAATPMAETGVDLARQGVRGAYRAATGPHLTTVSNPALVTPTPVVMPMPAQMQSVSAPNSLWQAGARTFFNDQRATRIGDILTVKVAIDDSAEMDNTTNRTRGSSSELGITSLFGKEEMLGRLLPPGGNFDPGNLVGAEGSSQANGTGAISRQEKIELSLAATISQILPNGNLVVVGKQEVRINGELRELTVAGIVRPEDVAANNSIRHDQMAEARISYGGRGSLSAVQKPRWGQRVVDAVSPW
jgi:flagellar L-ring protein precursor FlgH